MNTPLSHHTTRRAAVAGLALLLTGGLTACGKSSSTTSATPAAASSTAAATASASASAATTPSASATPTKKPTVVNSIDAITVTPTTPGKVPTITGKWPLAISKTQVKVLTQGTGAVIPAGATVKVNYHGLDAATGKVFDSSMDKKFGHATPATFSLSGVVPGFTKAIQGQKIGSRVVVFMTGADGYGSTGNTQAGIGPNDSLVFVVDILGGPTPVAAKAGFPTVSTDAKGFPVLTIPKTAAPTTAESEVLIKGAGDKVTAAQQVLVAYRAYDWATGKLLEDGYTQQAQAVAVAQLVPDMQKAIVGQTVGSRLVIVLPPSSRSDAQASASGSASPSASATPSTQTVVYVMDIQQAG